MKTSPTASSPKRAIAVNFSAVQFRQRNVITKVAQALSDSGLAPALLEIELTESAIMCSGSDTTEILNNPRRLGIRLAIDDFGTGYSSLQHLRRFPIDKLKIDRSFVQDLPGNESDAQLVSTMITMAQGLKLNVVAEGVEMPDQEAFLASKGCDVIQGYLVSRPVPAAQIETLLAAA